MINMTTPKTETSPKIKKGVFPFNINTLNIVNIRFNALPDEIFFFRIDYGDNYIVFTIDKNTWRIDIKDYNIGNFQLTNKDVDNSNLSQQILAEFGSIEFDNSNSIELEYIKPLSIIKINGKEMRPNSDKVINLIQKLYHVILSYIISTLPSYLPLQINEINIFYTYIFRRPLLRNYFAVSSKYIYSTSFIYDDTNICGNTLTILRQDDNKLKEVFEIHTKTYKYSQNILQKVINLILQSKIKTDIYEIRIGGKNVTINNLNVKVDTKLIDDITSLIKNQIEYNINSVKDKLNLLI